MEKTTHEFERGVQKCQLYYSFISLENNPSNTHSNINTRNTGTRGADMEHYRRGIYSISQFHVSDTYDATYETDTSSDGIVDLKRTTVDGVRNLKMEPESITMDGPGGIRYVDIDSTHHSILHLNRQTKSTLVGANLVNMGRRDYHADNQDEVHEFSSNIVIGTDSGNVRIRLFLNYDRYSHFDYKRT